MSATAPRMGTPPPGRARAESTRPLSTLFGLGLALALATASVASADLLLTVGSKLDEIDAAVGDGKCRTAQGTCTLRAAVMEASAATGSGTVTIRLPAGRYLLIRSAAIADGGDLDLTTPTIGSPTIVLEGEAPSTTFIDANSVDRAIEVGSGRTAEIFGVSIVHGVTEDNGGGVGNAGTLTVGDCAITDNESGDAGGGIFNANVLTLIRSTVSGNRAEGGGGLFNFGMATIDQSTVSGNEVTFNGGGIFNLLTGGLGPSLEAEGTVFLVNSTVSGNRAGRHGGGIFDLFGTVWTYNATIVSNRADADDDDDGIGGGVHQDDGAIYLRNTLVAGNGSGPLLQSDCFPSVGIFGHTVFGTTLGCTVNEENEDASIGSLGSLAEIGPLRSNGGWTETHALLAPSALIDGGTALPGCTYGGSLLVDQRGGPRGLGTLCDIGAFEAGALPAGSIFADDFEAGNLHAW